MTTSHGEVNTPVFMPVGTQATVKTLSPADLVDLGAEIIHFEAATAIAGITEIIRRRRVSHLVLVHSPRKTVGGLRRPSLADELLERVPSIDIHLIAADKRSKDLSPSQL